MSRLRHLKPAVPLERREIGILALFSVLAFTQGWSGAAITHALPFVQDDFALNDSEVFDLMALVRATALIAFALSWWGDRGGRRLPLLIAFAILPAANLATAFASGAAAVTALQAVGRIGTIALGSLAIVVVAEEVAPKVRGYAIALYALVGSMGTGFGLLLRPLGDDGGDGWRLLFGLSAIPLLVLPLLILRLRESRAFTPTATRHSFRVLLGSGLGRRFWPMAGLAFALSAFASPTANLALVRLENELGWSAASASLLLATASAPGVALGLLGGGRIADMVGRRPTEFVAILVGVIGGVAFYFLEAGPLVGVAIFVSTVGAFGFGPAFGSHRSELFPTEVRATAAAWIVNASILGGLAGFSAGRFVVDSWGIPTTIAVLGGLLLAATSLIPLLPETKGWILTGQEEGPLPPSGAIPV